MAKSFQSNFTQGELSPLSRARVDREFYYKSLKRARNVICLPHGGVRRRFGLTYVDEVNVDTFDNVALFNFSFTSTQQYLIVFIPNQIYIYKDEKLVKTIGTDYNADTIKNIRVAQELETMIIVDGQSSPKQLVNTGGDSGWSYSTYSFKNLPTFDFDADYDDLSFTLSSTTGSSVTVTASGALFSSEDVGGTFEALPGFGKIKEFDSTTQIKMDVLQDFGKTSYTGEEVLITEPAFSSTRGWPAAVSFYQERLVFASTDSLPNGVFFSTTNAFNNFFQTPFDGSALNFRISGTENKIQYIENAVSLFFFTPSSQYATPPLVDTKFTIDTAVINRITSDGLKNNVEPIYLDNQIFYIDSSGTNLISLVYDIQRNGYVPLAVGYNAKTLIRNPIDVSKTENEKITQGNYIYMCNSDGTLLIYQTEENENINSWTLCSTENGDFGKTQTVGDNTYFVIKRRINSRDVFYLEKSNYETFLDSSIIKEYTTPSSSITGLNWLEHETVAIRGDGTYLGDNFFVDNGTINLEDSYSTIEVGFNFVPEITPLPINLETQSGQTLYNKKRINTVTIQVIDTHGITINDNKIYSYRQGGYELSQTPTLYSGIYEVPDGQSNFWDYEINIKQPEPYNLTLISIELDYELGR